MDTFTIKDIEAARERIKDYAYYTPLEEALHLGNGERKYFFKLENQQRLRAFKIRGALARMSVLTDEEKELGVATVSSGNHGGAVAYAAKLLGLKKPLIFVPAITPKAKVEKIQKFGGDVRLVGNNYDECHIEGMKYIEEHGLLYIDSWEKDPIVYAGQGTIGLEIIEQNPDIDTVIVPIGGGGLATGVAVAVKAMKPSVRVIGVQTAACPAFIKSVEDGVQYGEYPTTGESICESLVGGIGELSFAMREVFDDLIAVEEKTIRKAVKHMILEEKTVAEGGSCTTVAAVMDYAERIGGKNISLVISGGNIDGSLIQEIMGEEL